MEPVKHESASLNIHFMSVRSRAVPQQQRARAMRQRLLDTAIGLLERDPGRMPTTQELADRAHVSIGTVYRYFDDMTSIVDALRHAAIHDIMTTLASSVGRAIDATPEESTLVIVEALTSAFEKHAAVVAASLRASAAEGSEGWPEVEEPLRPLARVLPSRLRPELSDAEIDDLVFVTMGAAASLCLRIALQRPEGSDRDAMVRTAARMLVAALSPEGSPTTAGSTPRAGGGTTSTRCS